MKEREVKLSAGEGFEFPDLGGMHGVVATPRTKQILSTVYLDSDDLRLARWGVSFRHRGGMGWTVKLRTAGAGALLVRDEVVFKGRSGTPPVAAANLVTGYMRHEALRPQVRLRTLRRGILLHDEQGRLLADVVDDAVSVLDGPLGGASFRELEVETKRRHARRAARSDPQAPADRGCRSARPDTKVCAGDRWSERSAAGGDAEFPCEVRFGGRSREASDR